MGFEVVLHLPPAVELIGGSEVTTLHLLEDSAGVDEPALGKVEVDTSPQELFSQKGDVEVVRVEAGEVRTGKLVCQRLRQLLESRLVLHVVVADTRQLCDNGFDGALRIDQFIATLLTSVGIHLNIRYLNDTILDQVKTRRLQVEDDEWLLKIQFHITLVFKL